MEASANNSPLIVIVGQTASGKTALAIDLARRFGGEIIAADSRTVYRGLDIGTAKPTQEEQRSVKHHLIDVVDPTTYFSVANFKQLARAAIADIAGRGKLPILVGGTGLYVDAVVYDFQFRSPADADLRKELELLEASELQARLIDQGIPLPANPQNPRHLIRSLETGGQVAARQPLRPNTLLVGLQIDPELLREKIARRVDAMVADGLVEEVKQLASRYGWNAPALQAPAYRAFRPYVDGAVTLDEAKNQFVQYDWQYAKRQKTWFKRNGDIVWVDKPDKALSLIAAFLNK